MTSIAVVPLDPTGPKPEWATRWTDLLGETDYKPWYRLQMGVVVHDGTDAMPAPHRWNGSALYVTFRTFDSDGPQAPADAMIYVRAMLTGKDVYVAPGELLEVKKIGFRRPLPYSLLVDDFSLLDALGWLRREVFHYIETHEADEFLHYRGHRLHDPHKRSSDTGRTPIAQV